MRLAINRFLSSDFLEISWSKVRNMKKTIFYWVFVFTLFLGLCGRAMDVAIEWDPALTTVDGELLDHVHCYKVFYSDTSGVYSNFVVVTETRAVVPNFQFNKTMYFAVKTCTSSAESDFSEELVWTAPVMPDADDDGLSDTWEQQYFQTLELACDVSDCDADGVSDWNEFVAGSDPLDSADKPVIIIQIDQAGGAVIFEARQAGGTGYENRVRSYTLQQCDDLSTGIWTDVAGKKDIPAADQVVSYSFGSTDQIVFYRTKIDLL
jgi:hypothetical protein